MKMCSSFLWFARQRNRQLRRKKDLGDSFVSVESSVQSREVMVRLIHPGGREELYQNDITASKLIEKYPSMCVARPQVFKCPHESILMEGEKLLIGHKYYMIPASTVKKLKLKQAQMQSEREQGKEIAKIVEDAGGDCSEESVCSARDFYVSREKWSRCITRKHRRGKKAFLPPIQRSKAWRKFEWEPSLDSIEELSP